MLSLSLSLLLMAGAFGGVLAALHLRAGGAAPGWVPGALHGLLGLAGLVALLFALRGPPRGEAMGVAAFGRIAAVLLVVALLAGVSIVMAGWRYRRVPGLVIGFHATIAISGIVILAAYVMVG